jgi:hypothetical protein
VLLKALAKPLLILFRKQDASRTAISLSDDADAPATTEHIVAENPVAVYQGILVCLLAALIEVTSITAMVATQV